MWFGSVHLTAVSHHRLSNNSRTNISTQRIVCELQIKAVYILKPKIVSVLSAVLSVCFWFSDKEILLVKTTEELRFFLKYLEKNVFLSQLLHFTIIQTNALSLIHI